MHSPKVLSAVAALALILPLVAPTTSFAQGRAVGAGGGRVAVGGGAPALRGGGGSFAAAPAIRGGGGPAPSFSGGRAAVVAGSPVVGGRGGNWNGGTWRDHRGWRGGGFWPGVAAGAAVGALGSYAYYGGDPYYYGDPYTSDYYYDDSPSVAVVPETGGDAATYCMQQYRSYDPASGTYLGYDGLRHPCP
jgi:hypothetical protein